MASNELIETLNAIKLDKDTNLKPENLKKGVSLLGIDGTLESNSGVKLFETVEDMNNDENPQIDDLAIVYREDIQNMTVGTQTQYITFPETVVLPEAFIGDVYCMLRAVDETVMFDGQVMLSQSMFDFNGYTNTGMIRVRYISSDGITYNRDEFMGESGDLTNPVDLGTSVGVYMSEEWNDNLGYFMQIGGMTFDGLYEYASKTDTNKAAWLTNLHEVEGKGVYDLERENGLDISNVSSICTEIISHFGLSTSQGHYIAFIQSDNVLSAYVGLTIEHNNIVGTQLGLVQDTENNWGIGTYSKELTDGAYKITLGDTLTYTKLPAGTKIPVKDYDWGHWKYGSCAPTDKFTVLSVRNGVVSVASAYHIYGYNVNYEYALNTYGVTSAYYFAPNQYTLTESNQLLPGISAYSKNGNIVGDGSIYDNLDSKLMLNALFKTNVDNLPQKYIYDGIKDKPIDLLQKYKVVNNSDLHSKAVITSSINLETKSSSSSTDMKNSATIKYILPNQLFVLNRRYSSFDNPATTDEIYFYGMVNDKIYYDITTNSIEKIAKGGFVHKDEIYIVVTNTNSSGNSLSIYKLKNSALSSVYDIDATSNRDTKMLCYLNDYIYCLL